MKRISATLAAVAVAALTTLAFASPSVATEPDPHYATGEWQLRDWTGPYPDVETSPADESTATCDTVTLVKPDVSGDADPLYGPSSDGDVGTSHENTDLDLAVQAGDTLLVDYTLSAVGNAAAGAVRMFAYSEADADTLNTAPTLGFVAAPESTPGTLELPFAAGATIGTFGLTYDASNDTEGTVTFTNLRLESTDGEAKVVLPVAFCAEPRPETSAAPTTTQAGPELAKTGSSLTGVLIVAGAMVLGGIVLFVVARNRRRV